MIYFFNTMDHRDSTLHAVKRKFALALSSLLLIVSLGTVESIFAGYKARTWEMGKREDYPASLTSEGVTIAVKPFYTDALAAQVFDKKDMVTRGIMPLAVLIFNDNDFPIEVEGRSIELIKENDHISTMLPYETVYRLFRKKKGVFSSPIPKSSESKVDMNALEDFEQKFLMYKSVAAHDKGSGFLYMHIPDSLDLSSYLSEAVVYIPKIVRQDDGSRLIYFEIELKSALKPISTR